VAAVSFEAKVVVAAGVVVVAAAAAAVVVGVVVVDLRSLLVKCGLFIQV